MVETVSIALLSPFLLLPKSSFDANMIKTMHRCISITSTERIIAMNGRFTLSQILKLPKLSDLIAPSIGEFYPDRLITSVGLYEAVLIDTVDVRIIQDPHTKEYDLVVSKDVAALHRFLNMNDRLMLPCPECRQNQPYDIKLPFNPTIYPEILRQHPIETAQAQYKRHNRVPVVRQSVPLDGEVSNYNAFDHHLPTYYKGSDCFYGVMPELLKEGLGEQDKLEIAYNCKEGILADFGEIRRNLECTLNSNHKGFVDFVLYEAVDSSKDNGDAINDETYKKLRTCLVMEKVGQYPSMADMQLFDIEKYKTVLSSDKFREFKRALGLYASGVGCGSFVYLRRIFEHLIKEAASEMSNMNGWDASKFRDLDFNRKIEYLEGFGKKVIPDDLSHIKKRIFGTLSTGVHESSDQECIELFPAMKFIIEELLNHKLASKERERKLKELTKVLP